MTDEELLDHLIALHESWSFTHFGHCVLDNATNILLARLKLKEKEKENDRLR